MGKNIFMSILILYLNVNYETDLTLIVRRFVHQTDLSEHCRRRVIPSIFLGNRVMEASSHVMHFSLLEVPYSCFLSVRAESGYNIILVVELLSDDTLVDACLQNRDQFIVYELGETFGGYWGPHSDEIMKPQTRNYTQYYTLKTTPSEDTERPREYKNVSHSNETFLKQTFPEPTDKEPDFIRMEVPLVNVSGNLQLGGPLRHTYNAEEIFDFIYDVTPRNGSEYETSIIPIVQFSIRPQKNDRYYDGTQRYELDYNIRGFTKDPRLIFSTLNKRMTFKKGKWLDNRKYNIRMKNAPFSRRETVHKYQKLFTHWSPLSTNSTITSTLQPTLDSKYTDSYKIIDDIMKYYNKTATPRTKENDTINNILHDISNMDHNFSVYLVPNISVYANKSNYNVANKDKGTSDIKPFTEKYIRPILLSSELFQNYKKSRKGFNRLMKKISNNTLKLNENDLEANNTIISSKVTEGYTITDALNYTTNVTRQVTTADIKINNTNTKENTLSNEKLSTSYNNSNEKNVLTKVTAIERRTMVDHESWDNIVQAAPVMAVVLNKTDPLFDSNDSNQINVKEKTIQKGNKRKKRFIHSLRIENSRPRNLTTKRPKLTNTEPTFKLSDIQDLARLVELQDDEIEGRVALRYIKNYVGSVLFNICDFTEPKSRQTFLFNASRIVIAVSNFTLDRMMLVATPAQSLLSSVSRCPAGYLECQVVGTRVCIDSTNACDGVPNCGSYDIYDEDRLLCGATKDLQHNVYLAAFTFLAVLLTLIYTVHYWLKRCVPRVSEAFFVYTEASENTLFLDTVMRSPMDVDDASCKLIYSGQYFDDEIICEDKNVYINRNLCTKFFKKLFRFLICKRIHEDDFPKDTTNENDLKLNCSPNTFSFTEMELRKYALTSKDEAVQAGQSFDQVNKMKIENYTDNVTDSPSRDKTNSHDINITNELNLIKFVKENRSSSSQSDATSVHREDYKPDRRHAIICNKEKEIRSTTYDDQSTKTSITRDSIPVQCEVHLEKHNKSVEGRRLRFDDVPTMIPETEHEDDIETASVVKRNVALGEGHEQNLDAIEIEEVDSSSRDLRRFWTRKGKKNKKKEKLLLVR